MEVVPTAQGTKLLSFNFVGLILKNALDARDEAKKVRLLYIKFVDFVFVLKHIANLVTCMAALFTHLVAFSFIDDRLL